MGKNSDPEEIVANLSTKSAKIRALAHAGYSRSDIARLLDIRYQHVRNVLVGNNKENSSARRKKLTKQELLEREFVLIGRWEIVKDSLKLVGKPAAEPGVYAFVISNEVVYIGSTVRTLRQRLYNYARPGPSQLTNQRLNQIIQDKLRKGMAVEVITAVPGGGEWSGLPVDPSVGLEMGLIKTYSLPWNKSGT